MKRSRIAPIARFACAAWLLIAGSAHAQEGTWASLGTGSAVVPSGPGRLSHDGIYDPVRNRMMIFGGRSGSQLSNATWATLANGTWIELNPGGLPPARQMHTVTYDPIWDRLIVIGGYDAQGPRNDVWALSLSSAPSWIEITPAGPAFPARGGHAAVYDPVGQRIVVFGGYDGTNRKDDVWALPLLGPPTWSEITPPVAGPSARSGMSSFYDASRQRMVIFGGTDPAYLNETWAFSLSGAPEWSAVAATGALPPGREEHTAVYDPTHDRMVVMGGTNGATLGDMWSLSFGDTASWSQVSSCEPRMRWGHVAILDPDRNEIRVQGGFDGNGTTGSTWVVTLGAVLDCPPVGTFSNTRPARHYPGFTYDPVRNAMWLFGGAESLNQTNSVHRLNLGATPGWQYIFAAGTLPSPRRQCETIYDPLRDRLITFGGWGGGSYKNDTWALTSLGTTPTWTLLTPLVSPSPRERHRMIYDAAGDRVVLYGGYDGATILGDVWELRLGSAPLTWTNVTPGGAGPGVRSSHAAVYDPSGSRMLIFGGNNGAALNDVWQLSLPASGSPTWSQIPATNPPAPRDEHAMILDPVRNRLVVFAGNFYQDTWFLPLTGSPAWYPMSPQTGFNRFGHRAAYDPVHDRMVSHGGTMGGIATFNSTMFLTWGQPAVGVHDPIFVTNDHLVLRSATYQDGRLILDCSIPGTAALDVELLDVSGRRAYQTTWGAGRTGSQRIEIRTPTLPSGVYFARVRQNSKWQTRSVALLN